MGREKDRRDNILRALTANRSTLKARLAVALGGVDAGKPDGTLEEQDGSDDGGPGAVRCVLLALFDGIFEHLGTTGVTELSLPYEDLAFLYWTKTGRSVTKESLKSMFSDRFKGKAAKVWGSFGLGGGFTCDGLVVGGGPGRPWSGPGGRGFRIVVKSDDTQVRLPGSLDNPREHPFLRELDAKRTNEVLQRYAEALESAEELAKALGLNRDAASLRKMRSNLPVPRRKLALAVAIVILLLLIGGVGAVVAWRIHRAHSSERPVPPPGKQSQLLYPPRPAGTLVKSRPIEERDFRGVLEIYREDEYRINCRLSGARVAGAGRDSTLRWRWTFLDGGQVQGAFVTEQPVASFTFVSPDTTGAREVQIAPATTYTLNWSIRRAGPDSFVLEDPVTHVAKTAPAQEVVTTIRTEDGVFRRYDRLTGLSPDGNQMFESTIVPPPSFLAGGAFDWGDANRLPAIGVRGDPLNARHLWLVIVCYEEMAIGGPLTLDFGDGVVDARPSLANAPVLAELPADYAGLPVLVSDHQYKDPGTYTVVVREVRGDGLKEIARRAVEVR